MKKNLLTLGVLALSLSANAQFISYVGNGATVNVKTGALVYQGGGMKIVGTGVVDNSGNVMLVGSDSSKYETVTTSGTPKTDGGNFILRMTDETIGSLRYGQLYIKGLSQTNITGVVDKEYKDAKHGTYQQIALPFYEKKLSELSSELGKTFTDARWSQNEILIWNNKVARMDLLKTSQKTSDAAMAVVGREANTAYFALGSKDFDAAAGKKILKGVPYADGITAVKMEGAAAGINFGAGGMGRNFYRERYNSYIQDEFDAATPWTGTFGRNIYQYGNPFLTNLDLGHLGKTITNLRGVRVEPTGVKTSSNGSTIATGYVLVSYNSEGLAVGDVNAIVRPMQTFVIKLRDANPKTLNFDELRRFAYTPRAEGVEYKVTAARTSEPRLSASVSRGSMATTSVSKSTVKQLGVIALNAAGEEMGRTYYAVYNNAITGQPKVDDLSVQATTPSTVIGTFEESVQGGVDENLKNTYWLYINEANEIDFKGKEISLGIYNSDVASLKFEIRENANLIADSTSTLSSGDSFYINLDGKVRAISNGATVVVNSKDSAVYGLYYGSPITTTLSTDNSLAKPSSTVVAYDANISNYRMIFDTTWKTADVQVYDMAGKLVSSRKKVDASNPFVIELPAIKGTYIVTAISETGTKFVQKIIK